MLRVATGLSIVFAIVAAFVLYSTTVVTRRLEMQVQAAEQRLERLKSEIAVLKADRAFLARPTRIEPAALQQGLRPSAERIRQLDGLTLPAGAGGAERAGQ